MSRNLIKIIGLSFLCFCCQIHHTDTVPCNEGKNYIAIDEANENSIRTGNLSKRLVAKEITCMGKTMTSPEGYVAITLPFGGTIKKLLVKPGESIKKENPLAIIENVEFIKLQQEYLEAKYQLEYLIEDLKRQGELTLENATSIKKLQKAQAEYSMVEARMKGLEAQLRLAGLNPVKCTSTNYTSSIHLYAPIDGMVTDLEFIQGLSFGVDERIMSLLNTNQIQIVLYVPAKEAILLEKGISFDFFLRSKPVKKYSAKISSVGSNVENNDLIKIWASVQSADNLIRPGMSIIATIPVPPDTVLALPEKAIVWEGKDAYVFYADKRFYQKTSITAGTEQEGYVEILDAYKLIDKTIVIDGVDDIVAILSPL